MEAVREENQEPSAEEKPLAQETQQDEPTADPSDISHKSSSKDDIPTSTTSSAPSQPPPAPKSTPVGPMMTSTTQATATTTVTPAPETTIAPAESTTSSDKDQLEQQHQQEDQELARIVDTRSNLSELIQMESFLSLQVERCKFYKSYFDGQSTPTMATTFETFTELTSKDLELLRKLIQVGGEPPKYRFEELQLLCVPTNVEVKEKELHISVRTSGLGIPDSSKTYVIAEFEFPVTKTETHSESMGRWLHSVKIEPKKLICCSSDLDKQLDIIYSTDIKPFHKPDSKLTEYDRALQFFVDKGKSRTLKRKYKPVKLTFYEKTSFIQFDRKLGTVQVKVDAINEESSIVTRLPIMNGRKQTDGLADITVRVREPLVEKTLRTHREKLLVLT